MFCRNPHKVPSVLRDHQPSEASRENISKLEDRVVGNGIEIMFAVDLTGQTPLDYVEERVERGEGLVLWIGHDGFPAIAQYGDG